MTGALVTNTVEVSDKDSPVPDEFTENGGSTYYREEKTSERWIFRNVLEGEVP